MSATFSSSRILLPVRPWFIVLSVAVALMLNLLPPEGWLWMPDWIALVLVFWSIREPRFVGMGSAFVLGLAMDVADGSVLGQHALAYVVASYLAAAISKRVLWFPMAKQAVHVVPILLLVQVLQYAVRAMPGVILPGGVYFVGPLWGLLLWAPLNFLLLLPQYQPVERDANRPI